MTNTASKVEAFRKLHKKGEPFVIANAWDAGSARVLEGLGFPAIATTSAGFALTLGRLDYGVTREEALAHARDLSLAVEIPVSADLENGFGTTVEDAARTIREAAKTGLAGGSIEDSRRDAKSPILDFDLAVERVAAAAEEARKAKDGFVLTARAEAFLWGVGKLDDAIARLQAFEKAGADVLFAPGLPDLDAVRAVCTAVEKPVNVLVMGSLTKASLDDLANAGVARVSLGSSLAWSVYGSLVETASILARDKTFAALANHKGGAKQLKRWLR
jgi:2-methylisocitrate lyase-like PEP mutase family enzyme